MAILCHLRSIDARRQLEFIANIGCIFDENGRYRKADLAKVAFQDDPDQLRDTMEVISRR